MINNNCENCMCFVCPARLLDYCAFEDEGPCETCGTLGYTVHCEIFEKLQQQDKMPELATEEP